MPRTASIPGLLVRRAWPYVGAMMLGVVVLFVVRAQMIFRLSPQGVLAQGSLPSHSHWPSWVMLAWTFLWLALWVRTYHSPLGRVRRAVVCASRGYRIRARLVDVQADITCWHECGTRMDRAEYAVTVRNYGRGLAPVLFGKAKWPAGPPVMGSEAASATSARRVGA